MINNVQQLTQTISFQDKETEGLKAKLKESNGRFLQMVEECQLKVSMISELKRENSDFERRLKQT
eukprot:CAMPEP_0185599060 /NCGR_PEP_ID=MMETSP0434-20130131/82434_1 /TAXON_ID=626734 ORGANISM="Favella taraikaensis, Strain Fe Narragansett Bay" /NCGR_SAMPLE_ID=MMETSP0434 /ASSEMBLY_ACC=CAM_ASM_000379 /LENGTH=64 /DNA_ID=CAMNT_0028228293 /DNA_START=61 /DNA_END=255 /DNA_ORIENTATION=-